MTESERPGEDAAAAVVDADGNRIPWSEVSRIDDDEMRALMREIVDRLYTFHLRIDDPAFRAEINRWAAMTAKEKTAWSTISNAENFSDQLTRTSPMPRTSSLGMPHAKCYR